MTDWIVEHCRGPAGTLHRDSADLIGAPGGTPRRAAGPVRRRIRVIEAVGPALVLGSGQADAVADAARARAAGIAVARRRSGGGAVLVGPGRTAWVDVVVPTGDELWDDDVGRAAWWVGDAWAAALAELGWSGAAVWRGPMVRTGWSDRICFAGLGAGEVTVPTAGAGMVSAGAGTAKLVGISQRRTRWGALLQCAAPVRWEPTETLDVLTLDGEQRRAGAVELAEVACGLGDGADAVIEAVVASLQRADGAASIGQLP